MTVTIEDLVSLQKEIFEINSANGFWEMGVENRSFAQHIALVHSELSEALEADRKDLKDDKLTDYWGREVELADVVIRILDWFGAHNTPYYVAVNTYVDYTDFSEFVAELHLLLSKWYGTDLNDFGFVVLDSIINYVNEHDIALMEIIHKKLEVNRNRGYHHGGKKY